jgi:hypothetical protein
MLHVTNGDSVVHSFHDGGMPGVYLPWRDVLHDGAVPQRDSLDAMSDVRASEIAHLRGYGDYSAVRAEFAKRDATLVAFREHDQVVLWFEHDLYDQLQLLQILDWFSRQDLGQTKLTMIQVGSHPEVTPFYGLGQLTGAQIMALFPSRKPVTAHQLEIGRVGWAAFCSPEPSALRSFADRSEPEMPFLQAALQRLLEEYPSTNDRLGRIERELLTAAQGGGATRESLCIATWKMEPWPWGDNSVYRRLDGLTEGPTPAIEQRDDTYSITDYGRRLLAGDPIAVRARAVDTWLGGVHVVIR